MFKLIFVGMTLVVSLVFIVWLVLSPRKTTLQPALEANRNFAFRTDLMPVYDVPFVGERLMLRRVRGSTWRNMGPHTGFAAEEYSEPSMSVDFVFLDGYLVDRNGFPKVVIGRITDRGSGMHGWHVTMVKLDDEPIDFEKTQRFQVWIEKDAPSVVDAQGVPQSNSAKRHFFAGSADIVANSFYHRQQQPTETED